MRFLIGLCLALLLALSTSACGSPDSVSGAAIGKAQHGLSLAGIESINGTYGPACQDRSGNWSLAVAGGTAGTLDYPVLTVLQGNVACTLTLTHVKTVADGAVAATPNLGLATDWQVSASSFGSPISFYANARLEFGAFLPFDDAFTVMVVFSSDPDMDLDSHTAQFGVVSGSATADAVPVPVVSLDLSGVTVTTNVSNEVLTVGGDAVLTDTTGPGNRWYMIVDGGGLATYAAIDTAWLAGTPITPAATFAATDFNLVGQDLTGGYKKTLIIANIMTGVRSYLTYEITFNPAP